MKKTPQEWLKSKNIAEKENFTKEQIKEYSLYIKLAIEIKYFGEYLFSSII